jgi:hypothetical protein
MTSNQANSPANKPNFFKNLFENYKNKKESLIRVVFDFMVLSFILSYEFTMGHVFNTGCMMICYAFVYSAFNLHEVSKASKPNKKK